MLLKRISGLKREKEHLLTQVEQEEEYMNAVLSKRITQASSFFHVICLFGSSSPPPTS